MSSAVPKMPSRPGLVTISTPSFSTSSAVPSIAVLAGIVGARVGGRIVGGLVDDQVAR